MSTQTPIYKLRDWIPLNKIDWSKLSKNPKAIHILEKNLDKIDWTNLSLNPNAIHLLEQNQDKICSYSFSGNPAIFELGYNVNIKKKI